MDLLGFAVVIVIKTKKTFQRQQAINLHILRNRYHLDYNNNKQQFTMDNDKDSTCSSVSLGSNAENEARLGSDTENETRCPGKGNQRTQAEKKMDRILANRRSARRSRERRKKLQHTLEVSVSLLSKQNDELSKENNILKHELQVLVNLVNQMMTQGPAPSSNPLMEALMHSHAANTAVNANQAPPQLTNVPPQNSNTAAGHTADLFSGANDIALSQLLSGQNRSQASASLSQLLSNQTGKNSFF